MHKLTTTLIALALSSAPLMAQFTTPAGYLTTEGLTFENIATTNGYSYYFGRYSSMRYQQIDGEIKKKKLQVLTSVGFRPDYRSHSASTAMGRKWSKVTLTLSDGNFAKMTTNWTANQLSTPTAVFSGSVTWPSATGNPTTKPAAWDKALAFPFGAGGTSGSYVYTATSDLCLDYNFSGGVLANNNAWSGSTSSYYYLDGLYTLTATTYGRNVYKYIGTGAGDCRDSSRTSGYASGSIQVGLYGKGYTGNAAWQGKAVMQIFGSNTAPNSNVLHAIGIAGTTPGVAIGSFGCYNLMIDTTKLVSIYNIATNSSGSRSWLYVPIGDLSVLAPFGRTVSIWSQAAWTDSKTKQTMLTTGERCTPDFARKFNNSSPLKKCIYQYNPAATTGFGPYDQFYMNPITRFN